MQKFIYLLTKKQNSLGSAAIILMLMVIGSGLLGLVRLRILYHIFTAEETGVFFAAFRLPNFIFEILAMGSLTAAFIPVFTKYITKSEQSQAQEMASSVINLSILFLLFISIPILIWTEAISKILAPGFEAQQIEQMAYFTRIMVFFQVIPLIVGNFFTGILQSYRLFFIPALAPIFYNLGIIIGVVFFTPYYGLFGAVIGVVIGAALFMLIQLPVIIAVGYKHRLILEIKNKGVREVLRLVTPRLIGLSASQIDVTVDLMLASLLGPKMVTVFFLAQNLQQLPVRLYGATIAQAALPSLSADSVKEDTINFRKSVITSYHMILFLVVPTSVMFIVLRIPIVRLIYGASLFDWEATVMTAVTLSAFSVSIFAQSISHVLTRSFYALFDSRTPVTSALITIFINTVLSVFFITGLKLPVWSLGVSASISSIINAILLGYLLFKRVEGFAIYDILIKPLKIALISIFSGFLVFVPLKLMDELVFDTTRVMELLLLTALVTVVGIFSYLFLSWVFNIAEVNSFIKLYARIRKLKELIEAPTGDVVGSDVIKS